MPLVMICLERIFEMNEWQKIQHRLAEEELKLEYLLAELPLTDKQRKAILDIVESIVEISIEVEKEAHN
jgi:hypothetical protein